MEKFESKELARRLLQIKNTSSQIPVEDLFEQTDKVTNKEWAEHWVNIVVVSKMWKAFIKMVTK